MNPSLIEPSAGAPLTRIDRERANGHSACTLWLTGLSASGKSTVAALLERALCDRGVHTYLLDGDHIRSGLNRDLGFSPSARTENIRRVGEVAKLFVAAGVIVPAAFISPYRADRDQVRAMLEPGDFIEVFVDAPLEVCERRDPKGLYRRARAGLLPEFTGVSAPYEPPVKAEVTLRTAETTAADCVCQLIDYLQANKYIQPAGSPVMRLREVQL